MEPVRARRFASTVGDMLAIRRVLVCVEPEALRDSIETVLSGKAELAVMPSGLAAAMRDAPTRRTLLHPSARPDVVIADPALARALAPMRFTVIEIDPDSNAPLIAYREGAEVSRLPASLESLIGLIRTLAGLDRHTVATR